MARNEILLGEVRYDLSLYKDWGEILKINLPVNIIRRRNRWGGICTHAYW